MFPRIIQATPLGDYRLELHFTDGSHGVVDLAERVVGRGGVLRPLEAPGFFRQVAVDSEAGTIVWPNSVDFCPDVLYSMATGKPLPVAALVR